MHKCIKKLDESYRVMYPYTKVFTTDKTDVKNDSKFD